MSQADANWVLLGLPCVAAALSTTVTALAIRYAHRRDMLDQPGRRRSHVQPTPRGGGIGIVVAVLFAVLVPWAIFWDSPLQAGVIATSMSLVAGCGWWDDHRPLGVLPRLAVQVPAALALAWLVCRMGGLQSPLLCLGLSVVVVLSTIWSINLHNFMDGINGLLTFQAAWIFAALSLLSSFVDDRHTALLLGLAASCVAFLPFNFPRARIFLGDVGSGALGFLVAVVVWLGAAVNPRVLWLGLLLGSALAIDATCTLLFRFLHGRRWYSPHREHLYQWLVRRGRSHAQVVAIYMAWNLLLVAPLVLLSCLSRNPAVPVLSTALVYIVGALLWLHWRARLRLEVRARA